MCISGYSRPCPVSWLQFPRKSLPEQVYKEEIWHTSRIKCLLRRANFQPSFFSIEPRLQYWFRHTICAHRIGIMMSRNLSRLPSCGCWAIAAVNPTWGKCGQAPSCSGKAGFPFRLLRLVHDVARVASLDRTSSWWSRNWTWSVSADLRLQLRPHDVVNTRLNPFKSVTLQVL